MCDTHRRHSRGETLQRLFSYKAWANDRLLVDLAGLGDEPSIVNLAVKALSHSHVVDRIFLAHLKREHHTYTSANLSELPTLAQLSADTRTADQEYLDYVSTLGPDPLTERIDFTFTDGKPGCMSREEMLMHVITHGVGHRGQVSALMLLNSRTPAVDGFTTYLHTVEAAERRRSFA